MAQYFIAQEGKPTGPFDEAEVLRRVAAGELSSKDLCWREGMANWEPIAQVLAAPGDRTPATAVAPAPVEAAGKPPLYLYIPIERLILLSIVTFSLYEAYWIYRNWRYVKERHHHLTIRPFWRGWFGLFYCHSLLRRIHEDPEARAVQVPTFSPGALATGWVILLILSNVAARAPGMALFVASAFIPSFLCLVPVQRYVNTVTRLRNPGERYYPWSAGHWVCLAVGAIVWGLSLFVLIADGTNPEP